MAHSISHAKAKGRASQLASSKSEWSRVLSNPISLLNSVSLLGYESTVASVVIRNSNNAFLLRHEFVVDTVYPQTMKTECHYLQSFCYFHVSKVIFVHFMFFRFFQKYFSLFYAFLLCRQSFYFAWHHHSQQASLLLLYIISCIALPCTRIV